jgi:predicted transcriptional regulator
MSSTSLQAFASIRPVAGAMREEIIGQLREYGGATCDELEHLNGWRHQTASARINELKRDGLIMPDGTRPTRSGRKATVWVLA